MVSQTTSLYQWPLGLTDVRPCPQADGGDGLRLGDEPVPGLAGGIDDGLVAVKDTVREPVDAHVLPDVLDRVQLGRP